MANPFLDWLGAMAPKERQGVVALIAIAAGIGLFAAGLQIGRAFGALAG